MFVLMSVVVMGLLIPFSYTDFGSHQQKKKGTDGDIVYSSPSSAENTISE